jgi:hypothetical protein
MRWFENLIVGVFEGLTWVIEELPYPISYIIITTVNLVVMIALAYLWILIEKWLS